MSLVFIFFLSEAWGEKKVKSFLIQFQADVALGDA